MRFESACAVLLLFFALSGFAYSAERHALLIGNSGDQGQNANRSANAVHAMAKRLQKLQFRVEAVVNLESNRTAIVVQQFLNSIRVDDTVVFYYAGSAVQHRSKNYLLNHDACSQSVSGLLGQAIDLNGFVARLSARTSGPKLILLEASGQSKFHRQMKNRLKAGLASMTIQHENLVISSAARPDHFAASRQLGLGLYTGQWLSQLGIAGRPVADQLRRLANIVGKLSSLKQRPWFVGKFESELVLLAR